MDSDSGILSENQENDWESMPLDLKLEIIPKREIEDDEQVESPKSDQGFEELEEDDSLEIKEEVEETEEGESTSTPADDIVLTDEDCDRKLGNEVLSFDTLNTEMSELIFAVSDILHVRPGICRILLQKYKWNRDFLLEKFYDSLDINAFLAAADVDARGSVPSVTGECMICFEPAELMGLPCAHRFCSDCWAHYLTEKIVDSKECVIKCMAPQCKLLLEEGNVHEFISDQGVIICYQRLLVKSYVETNKLLKWCRGVDCENAVKVGYTSIRHVECTCGASFCFSCGNESHEPVNCLLMNFWQKREDKGSLHWMLINTKNCPKCSAPIEKNGGCQHMTCKSCGYEFCWMCLGNWNAHANCNVYTENVEQAREQSLNDLNRYTFYQSRYVGHQESLRLEKYLCAQVDAKMKELQDISFFTKGEVYFLKIAVNALHASRRTLMHSYVFGYYLEQNHSAAIFESNQQDLQKATEELSEILESMDFEDLETLKLKICHKYVYVEERRKKLLDHCAEGEDEDNWVFSQ